jgi:hypothetical protein
MTYIHWSQVFFVDPTTGEAVKSGTEGALALPTYGNYGGADYAAGSFGGELLTTASGRPYSQSQLAQLASGSERPVDRLDYLFYRHDVASAQTGDGYSRQQAKADVALIKSLTSLDASYDPEASLYAGFSTLALVERLAVNGKLNLLPPTLLVAAAQDGVGDIRYAFEHLPAPDLAGAASFLFEPTSDPTVVAFGFEVTTTSARQEFAEWVALNALNRALDFGEADDMPLATGFPISGTSEYQLTFNTLTRDVDLLSV